MTEEERLKGSPFDTYKSNQSQYKDGGCKSEYKRKALKKMMRKRK